jgi:hypothetical protein
MTAIFSALLHDHFSSCVAASSPSGTASRTQSINRSAPLLATQLISIEADPSVLSLVSPERCQSAPCSW